nr:hypothetical protein [Tanacetum cinerariifolium]
MLMSSTQEGKQVVEKEMMMYVMVVVMQLSTESRLLCIPKVPQRRCTFSSLCTRSTWFHLMMISLWRIQMRTQYVVDADDDEDEEEESSVDDDDREEEHLAPTDNTAIASSAVDLVPSEEETEPFEKDESC